MTMSLQTPNELWQRVIGGGVYAIAGVLAGMLLGLIPGPAIVLMILGGMFGAWIGSQVERAPSRCPVRVASEHAAYDRRTTKS
jgi:hypothetical protein